MPDFNEITLVGRVTKSPQVHRKGEEVSHVTFCLATNEKRKNETETTFFDCICFKKTAELLIGFDVSKGELLLVRGSIRMSYYEDKNGNKRKNTSVIVDKFQLFKTKKEKNAA